MAFQPYPLGRRKPCLSFPSLNMACLRYGMLLLTYTNAINFTYISSLFTPLLCSNLNLNNQVKTDLRQPFAWSARYLQFLVPTEPVT